MTGSLLYKRLVPLNLLFVLLCITNIAYAGISMISPCARFSPMGINCPSLPKYQSWDKQMNKPISVVPNGYAKPMCKHAAPWPVATEHWVAGSDVTIEFTADAGSVGGGFCQFSLSYDNGDSFVVIHEVLDTCFLNSQNPSDLVTSYTFKLPNNLPSIDMAIFAWTYANSTQESSFYMNCGDVSISGSSSTEFTGREMTLVNYPGYPQIYPDIDGISTGSSFYTDNVVYLTVTAIDENEANILKKRAKDDEKDNKGEEGEEGEGKEGKGGNSDGDPETETETDTRNQGNDGVVSALADDDKCEEEPLLLDDDSSEGNNNETDDSKSQSPKATGTADDDNTGRESQTLSEAGMDDDKCDDDLSDDLVDDPSDSPTDDPASELDDGKCDDQTDEPTDDSTDELDDGKCDDQTDDSSSESPSDSLSNSSSDSLSDSSSNSLSDSSSNSSSESPSEPSSDSSEMSDLDSASSENSDSSDSSEPSSTDFAYPVMPTDEPDLMCDVLSNSPVENFYMQNIYASYGYLTETKVADMDNTMLDDASTSSSTQTTEPTISSGDSKTGDDNNNVVNISID